MPAVHSTPIGPAHATAVRNLNFLDRLATTGVRLVTKCGAGARRARVYTPAECAALPAVSARNGTYDLPALSRYWNNAVARAIFDRWQVSGVTSALSGATIPVTYSVQGISDLTGGGGAGVDSRVDFACDPNLSRGDRSPTRAFRTECVKPPSRATNRVGTARGDELIGPGYLNWDLSLAKNIPLGGMRRLQFRAELYNAFNNVQFSTVNANAVFDQAGNQVNNEFGYYTAARDARRIQLMLRLQF